ncbi:uncharacterized protein LOC133039328 [Cannabis sativa]|uniref:uncharacterized protein LOC133039328 n=1 Tax=Cannabis sativa TaxID=3483 RepID=UPI0029CA4E67|nr:uncharacterized protein LOC133039328 [Cannabis sativa]
MPRRENCQTPGTSSSRPGKTSYARGTTDSTGPNNGRETNDISGPTDARGTNVTGWSDPFSSSISYGKFKEKMYTREDIEDHSHYISMAGTPGGELHVGKFFRDKEHLKMVFGLYAMKKGFDYYVRKSGTDIWYVTCKDTDCGWRLRAKKNVLSNMFEVSTIHNVHTCSLDLRGKDNRQASPVIVDDLIKDKVATEGSDQLPSDIRKSMHKDYGIQMSYGKAWRCREKALHLARGTPEDSYSKLPSYLHMLQLRNPGTITDFVVEDGRFKYCFFSLGPSIRGFRFCRPVVCIDGSFLKTRHQSNIRALDIVFPVAHHGACNHNIIMNVNHKFKTDVFTNHIYTCAYTYSRSEFHREFENIRAMNPAVAQYLEEIGFEKWVRSYFLGVRYSVMTSNWAESFNNTTKDARGFLITAAVAFLRSKV